MTAPFDANGKPLIVGSMVLIRAKVVAITKLRKTPYLILQTTDDDYEVVLNMRADQVERCK